MATTRKQYTPKFKARVAIEAIRGEKLARLGDPPFSGGRPPKKRRRVDVWALYRTAIVATHASCGLRASAGCIEPAFSHFAPAVGTDCARDYRFAAGSYRLARATAAVGARYDALHPTAPRPAIGGAPIRPCGRRSG